MALKKKVLQLFAVDDDEKAMLSVGLQLSSETTSTLTYTIYRTSPQQMRLVSQFFQFLEQEDADNVLVHDFLVSHTTLEDVFLRLTHGEGMILPNDDSTWDNEERIMDMQHMIRELEDKITGLTMRLKQVEEENSKLKQEIVKNE